MTNKQKLALLRKSSCTCSECGKHIYLTELDQVEVVKTRRGTIVVTHSECVKKILNRVKERIYETTKD